MKVRSGQGERDSGVNAKTILAERDGASLRRLTGFTNAARKEFWECLSRSSGLKQAARMHAGYLVIIDVNVRLGN